MADSVRPAEVLRAYLGAELRGAMKARDTVAVATIRSLLSALDNAGAVIETPAHAPVFGRSGDVPRRELTAADIEQVLAAEAEERRVAADGYERRGRRDDAARLRAELAFIAKLARA